MLFEVKQVRDESLVFIRVIVCPLEQGAMVAMRVRLRQDGEDVPLKVAIEDHAARPFGHMMKANTQINRTFNTGTSSSSDQAP